MGVNRAIRNLIYTNMLMDEKCKFSFIENQVSIFDLWKVERNREKISSNQFHQYLSSESQYIDFAYFSNCWRGSDHSICMNLWFTKVGNIMCEKPVCVCIEYCDGKLSLLHEDMLKLELLKGNKKTEEIKKVENELRLFKDEMLVKHKNSLIELANFGIDHNYNQEPSLNTVSQEFVVRMDNRSLTLSLSSNILNFANKEFYLTHYYRWHSDTIRSMISHNYIEESKLGPWSLQTNIPGMKRLVTKYLVEEHDKQTIKGVDALCQNLKVDYEQLPKSLQVEVEKVKSLRK